jgi:S1-C subfamily serine protease
MTLDDKETEGETATAQSVRAKESSVSSRPARTTSWAYAAGQTIGKTRQGYVRKERRGLIMLVVVVLLAGGAGFAGGSLANRNQNVLSGSLSDEKKLVTNESELISAISKTVGPSVVSVNTTTTTANDTIFGFGQDQTERGAGTGLIITGHGIVMTNRHVVPAGTANVSITLADGTTYNDVSVLGRTSSGDSLDVAFLKINDLKGKTLRPAVIGDSSKAEIGDSVVAIGNALGEFQNTVTAGIISGFGRSVQASSGSGFAVSNEDLDDLIQTDAAINEGNSGGPLVNLNGQVIGINTAIASNAENIGFSIPINDLKGLISQVIKTGKLERPYLGVRYVPLTPDIAKQYGLKVTNGAYIVPQSQSANGEDAVVKGSPADKAGLVGGDVITKVNGKAVNDKQSLTSLLNQYQPGDTVNLTIVRNGNTQTMTATLGNTNSQS